MPRTCEHPNPHVTEAIALLESGPKNRPALVASLGTELRVIEPTLTRLAQALDLKIENGERHIFGHGRADARLDQTGKSGGRLPRPN
ncbi:MAG: hypothetical protein E5Y77_22005 [Mesorhizobium sp.]|nr:MAG: hypothetical protein E5Y77_22005 [Mesorhizobium sp.]